MLPIVNADVQDGYYGRYEKNSESGKLEFIPKGKAIYLADIWHNIDDDSITLDLYFDYLGIRKNVTVRRDELINKTAIKELSKNGADVTTKTADVFIDSIRKQEEEFYDGGNNPTKVYKGLGWIKTPIIKDGKVVGYNDEYRSTVLIPSGDAYYVGDYDIAPKGEFTIWKNLILNEVIGYITLEIVLHTSLAAPVNALLATRSPRISPIVHLNFPSSRGKTVAMVMGLSSAGASYEGSKSVYNSNGIIENKRSLMHSWMATSNAIISAHLSNFGISVGLNEAGKSLAYDLTQLIFCLGEGNDKERSTPNQETKVSKNFCTTFLSTGEDSLLSRCRRRYQGLEVRVFTLESTLTKNAEHANRIKEVCSQHYGHANPRLVEYILKMGGYDYIRSIYDAWVEEFRNMKLTAPNADRFSEIHYSLFLTTATIATEALDIPFSIEKIKQFFIEYDKEKTIVGDVGLRSYKSVLEEVDVNIGNYVKKSAMARGYVAPSNKVYGRVREHSYFDENGKKVVKEYEIRPTILEGILKKYGHPNVKTCSDYWRECGLISCDSDRPTRSRKIMPNNSKSEDVYVFRVYDNDDAQEDIE